MANYNKVLLVGNLTRDPELRYTPKGTAVGDLGLAINRKFGGGDGSPLKEETTFVDVTVWGRDAENADKYLRKGRSVMIEGRLQLDTWEDKSTGQKRNKLKVVAETVQYLGGGGGEGTSSSARDSREDYSQSQSNQRDTSPQGGSAADDFSDEEDDDIPF